jgi:hypothetical protein
MSQSKSSGNAAQSDAEVEKEVDSGAQRDQVGCENRYPSGILAEFAKDPNKPPKPLLQFVTDIITNQCKTVAV